MERFSFIFLTAGIGFFIFAFTISGILPMLPVKDLEVQTVKQLAQKVPLDFIELQEQYPEAFKKAFGDKSDSEALEEALVVGRGVYVAEACWHCHSQQVRPWGNDELRFGRVSYPEEYHNKLNMPPLWGTRRIGPDLIREAGRHSNDWHVAHFFNPPDVSPWSVMPSYPWFYEKDGLTPNKKGLSLIAYMQWLGSYHTNIRNTVHDLEKIDKSYPPPVMNHATKATAKPEASADAPTDSSDSQEDSDY